jgi:hypothetical protein
MLWMAAFGVALFLFFACPPVRRRTVRAARACWSQIRAKLPRRATHPARRPPSSHPFEDCVSRGPRPFQCSAQKNSSALAAPSNRLPPIVVFEYSPP